MGYDLFINNPATSGSHSWQCILVSNTSDSAMTKLGYCGLRERFSSDVELAKVFWKLWHSKKEYLDLPDGWSTPETDQKFYMVCEAMQAGFDPFDHDEESGEEEPEDMRDFSIDYWRQMGRYGRPMQLGYLWNAKELYIRRDMLKNYLKDLNSGVSEDIVDSHYWPEFTSVEKDSIYGMLQWWDSSLNEDEIDTWFSQYPPMINVVETRWIEDARPELFIEMPLDFNPDETYVAESKRRGPYVFPKRKAYPIGNLEHAKLALTFSTWPDNKPDAKKVRDAVFKRYPELRDWFKDGKYEKHAETFASETCECGELEDGDGEIYECNCCDGIFCPSCIENGDISAFTTYANRPEFLDDPRITETDTGYMGPQGAVCGECMASIEYELGELTPIHEIMEDEQGTANLSSESKELKRTSCCCGATVSSPCACMYAGVMNCSANAPMCPCYKALAEKNAESPTTKSKSKHITEIILITALIGGVIASMNRK